MEVLAKLGVDWKMLPVQMVNFLSSRSKRYER